MDSSSKPLTFQPPLSPVSAGDREDWGPAWDSEADTADYVPRDLSDSRAQILAVLDECRPWITADGGDVSLVAIQGDVVRLRLSGTCTHCALASHTLGGIKRRLVAVLGPGIRVLPAGAWPWRRRCQKGTSGICPVLAWLSLYREEYYVTAISLSVLLLGGKFSWSGPGNLPGFPGMAGGCRFDITVGGTAMTGYLMLSGGRHELRQWSSHSFATRLLTCFPRGRGKISGENEGGCFPAPHVRVRSGRMPDGHVASHVRNEPYRHGERQSQQHPENPAPDHGTAHERGAGHDQPLRQRVRPDFHPRKFRPHRGRGRPGCLLPGGRGDGQGGGNGPGHCGAPHRRGAHVPQSHRQPPRAQGQQSLLPLRPHHAGQEGHGHHQRRTHLRQPAPAQAGCGSVGYSGGHHGPGGGTLPAGKRG